MAKNGPDKLFEDAFSYNNTISLAKANDVSSFRLSYQNVQGNDILPNSRLDKMQLLVTHLIKLLTI